MKILRYLLGSVFKHVFALIVTLLIFAMLAFGSLSETGQTRMEDLAAMIVGYYFLASMSGVKKDEAIEKLADTQKQLVETQIPITPGSVADTNTVQSGDTITVTKG